jgi:hypothetical protein
MPAQVEGSEDLKAPPRAAFGMWKGRSEQHSLGPVLKAAEKMGKNAARKPGVRPESIAERLPEHSLCTCTPRKGVSSSGSG